MTGTSDVLSIEVVTHCFQYATLLRHQLSSLVKWPPAPGMRVVATVFYTEEDEDTANVLEWFGGLNVERVAWNWHKLEKERLFRRSIGRNLAALSSACDWVWFTDADYWFGEPCWKGCLQLRDCREDLVYPRHVFRHRSHELGDLAIESAKVREGLVFANVEDFEEERMPAAIGGVQITRGDVCRIRGYLRHSRRAQASTESGRWQRCVEDVWFRKDLGTKGKPIELNGVYRMRHSKAGRFTPGLCL